jgi:hypothetical protein
MTTAESAVGVAAGKGGEVAAAAGDEVARVAGEAASHGRGLLDEAVSLVEDQARVHLEQLAAVTRSFADDARSMGESGDAGPAADLVRRVADSAGQLSDRLGSSRPREVLADLRQLAQARPGAFLLGSLACGVLAGRLVRGATATSAGSGHDRAPGRSDDDSRPWPVPVVPNPARSPAASTSWIETRPAAT